MKAKGAKSAVRGRAGAAGGGRAVGGGGDRPDRADRHQRGGVRADLQGGAAQPAADVRAGAGEDGGHFPAADRAAEGGRDAAVLRRRAAGEPRRSCLTTAGGRWRRAPGRRRAGTGRPRSDGAGAVAAVRGDGGVAASARRRARGGAGALLRGRADAAAPERGAGGAGVGAATRRLPTAPLERPVEAHRRAVREHLAHVDALRGELEAEGMPTELLDGEQVARLLWERFNPTQGRQRPPPAPSHRGGARRARRTERPRSRPGGGDPPERADRAVEPRLPRLAPARRRSTATSSRRSWCRTRRGARTWGGCTGRC